jgi:hypothetical protein
MKIIGFLRAAADGRVDLYGFASSLVNYESRRRRPAAPRRSVVGAEKREKRGSRGRYAAK